MPVTQISVFVENKPGRFAKIATRLERVKVKILAFCIADAGDFGIIRLIVNKPEIAIKALKGFAESIIQVVIIPITERVSVSKIANLLGSKKVNIDYAYTSTIPINGNPALILRVDDIERTEKILMENDIKVLAQEDLK
ncbi:MAG: acetolactate synthase [archaeon]|nr:acetolactate synthase [archaeon]MCP8319573.1 acetolactate synthase [archaeon]